MTAAIQLVQDCPARLYDSCYDDNKNNDNQNTNNETHSLLLSYVTNAEGLDHSQYNDDQNDDNQRSNNKTHSQLLFHLFNIYSNLTDLAGMGPNVRDSSCLVIKVIVQLACRYKPADNVM